MKIVGEDKVPDEKSNAGFDLSLLFEPDPDNVGSGYIVIDVTTPSGRKTGTTIEVQS